MKTEDHNFRLENQVCFPIYALARGIMNAYRPFLDELELTYPQYLVLMVLWQHETLSVKDIGELLHLDSGTLTPLLKRMESKNLIIRKRKSCDERVVQICLTGNGKEMRNKVAPIPDKLISKIGVSIEELEELRTVAFKILNKL
jgi:DNA-binding MarR family transcriptional regulator